MTHRYSWSVERNDKALMNYFFVHARSPPRLCSVDLPGGSIWDETDQIPAEDDVGSPGGVPVSKVLSFAPCCMTVRDHQPSETPLLR